MLSVFLLYESWEVVSLHHPRTHFIRLRVHQSIFSLLKMAVAYSSENALLWALFCAPTESAFFFSWDAMCYEISMEVLLVGYPIPRKKKKKKVVKYLLWLLFSMILLHSCARKDCGALFEWYKSFLLLSYWSTLLHICFIYLWCSAMFNSWSNSVFTICYF